MEVKRGYNLQRFLQTGAPFSKSIEIRVQEGTSRLNDGALRTCEGLNDRCQFEKRTQYMEGTAMPGNAKFHNFKLRSYLGHFITRKSELESHQSCLPPKPILSILFSFGHFGVKLFYA